jgi:hypothetical protein
MDVNKLKEIEDLYETLKYKLDTGEISGDDLKSELKKMMVRDEDNRYWMLGSKSGGWYVYDGSAWNAGNPYGQKGAAQVAKPQERLESKPQEHPEPSANHGEEKKAESEALILCKFCESRIQKHDLYCNFCGGQQKGTAKSSAAKIPDGELLIKAVRIPALIFFLGGVGLIVGVIFGAVFGIFKIFGDWIYQFPTMLQEMRGKIQGGLFFGALGGIFGFLAFAVLAVLQGLFFNLIAYIFGGLRFKVKS